MTMFPVNILEQDNLLFFLRILVFKTEEFCIIFLKLTKSIFFCAAGILFEIANILQLSMPGMFLHNRPYYDKQVE